ncbi:hypothetical protein PoB_004135500 [Plakobranchus ocellatus]|uniref:Uncharacterized protein n=1 Tax=Plakobranchus ocellatus TaxID=259542 RepID=A0AAV4B6Y3_9GAST|nr:hypothetical protein PoB_004135500 [Plakobranchus ocellatus]
MPHRNGKHMVNHVKGHGKKGHCRNSPLDALSLLQRPKFLSLSLKTTRDRHKPVRPSTQQLLREIFARISRRACVPGELLVLPGRGNIRQVIIFSGSAEH